MCPDGCLHGVSPVSSEALFEISLDTSLHQAITGALVVAEDLKDSSFETFKGSLAGKIVDIVRLTLIVHFLRSTQFKVTAQGRILISPITPERDKGGIDLIKSDMTDPDFDEVSEG